MSKTTAAKSKAEAPSAEKPEVSLAEQLRAAQAAAEEYVESVALKEKAASPLQPLEWHRLNLRLRFGRSALDCALALIDQEKK
jgi:hypothetical protein